MPCGGIWTVKPFESECFYCGKTGQLDHFCEEWDTGLHAKCVRPFLATPEGQVVLNHGHEVRLTINGKSEFLAQELSKDAKQIITK